MRYLIALIGGAVAGVILAETAMATYDKRYRSQFHFSRHDTLRSEYREIT